MRLRVWMICVMVLVLATACSGDDPPENVERVTTSTSTAIIVEDLPTSVAPSTTVLSTTSTAPEVLRATIDWEICGRLQCGTVEVPIDYDDPSAGTISIAVNILRAADADRRLGVLMVNPGGPGGSGLSLANAFAFGAFPTELTDNFDIVGFDPRGVGESGPTFACGESGEQLAALDDVVDLIDAPDEIVAVEAAVGLCTDSMGIAAGQFGTGEVVRDMDEIRKAIGEEQISFLGFSYGSVIGVWYATLFPDRVRAMVIDGADNPVDELETAEQRLASAHEEIEPINRLLEEAIDACSTPSCPIYNNGDPRGYYFDAVEKLHLVNEAMADNPDAGFLSLITPLYNEATWPQLWEALADLNERDDPSLFVEFGKFQLGDDPGAVNFTAHVNCLDSWALQPGFDRDERQLADEEFFALEDELNAQYPLLAAIDDESTPTCAFYDLLNPGTLDVPFDGGGVSILVIGNTSDPVTSFGESEELAIEILSNGVLVEADHPSHTVYPDNDCVNDVVHDVLLDVAYPTTGVRCTRETSSDLGILIEVCEAIAPQQAPTLAADRIPAVCAQFAGRAIDELGADTISAALFGNDADAAEAMTVVLNRVLRAATS